MREVLTELNLEGHFLRAAYNNHWSNYRLYEACAQLSPDEYLASRPSFFGSIHATLNHLLIVDLLYIGRMTGQELVSPECEDLHDDLPSLREDQANADEILIDLCSALSPRVLRTVVTYQRQSGETYEERVVDVLSHLFVHQNHHRGQVHGMLSATSVVPPQLDEFYLRGDLALRRGEMETLGFVE